MGDAHVGARLLHQLAQRAEVGGAALDVDVVAVVVVVDDDDLGTQAAQRRRARERGGAVAGVERDRQALEVDALLADGAHRVLDVHLARLVHLDGDAQLGAARHGGVLVARLARTHDSAFEAALLDERLDLVLDRVGQLEALRIEQLDAVVLRRIMGCGDDRAARGVELADQQRHRRRRDDARQKRRAARAGDAGDHRRLQHVAGKARVLADHDRLAEKRHGGLAEPVCQLAGELGVRHAANAVGSEKSCHVRSPPSGNVSESLQRARNSGIARAKRASAREPLGSREGRMRCKLAAPAGSASRQAGRPAERPNAPS